MELRKAICACGHVLGNKRIDLSDEKTAGGTCPHCHREYVILYGSGRVKVIMKN